MLVNSPPHAAAPSCGPEAPLDHRGERTGNDEQRKGNILSVQGLWVVVGRRGAGGVIWLTGGAPVWDFTPSASQGRGV